MYKMNLLLVTGLVMLLFVNIILAQSTQDSALKLARDTAEGDVAYELKKGLDALPQCTESEYKAAADLLSPYLIDYGFVPDTNASEMIADSKACDASVREDVEQKNEIYIVSYSLELSSSCPLKGMDGFDKEHFIEIKTDPASNSAKTVKGQFDEATAAKAQQMKFLLPLIGDCLAPLLLSTSYLNSVLKTTVASDTECIYNGECETDERCVAGACGKITGECGEAKGHTWQKYECGDEAGCATCDNDKICKNHKCAGIELKMPEEILIGEPVNVTLLVNNEPVGNEKIELTRPSGKSEVFLTDKDGKIVFIPASEGNYGLSTLGKTKTVVAKSKGFSIIGIISSVLTYIMEDPVKTIGVAAVSIIFLVIGSLWLFRKMQAKPIGLDKPEGETEEQ